MQPRHHRLLAGFDPAQQLLSPLGERRDPIEIARLDVADEEPDIRAGDKRFSRARDDDADECGIAGRIVERALELRDDVFVERVQSIRPIDGYCGDAVGNVRLTSVN